MASAPDKLAADIGDKWYNGKVASNRSLNVPYGGVPLHSGERCRWKVRVWAPLNADGHDSAEGTGAMSAWSAPACFEMGLLSPEDWQNIQLEGVWIPDAFIGPMASLMNAIQTDGTPITDAADNLNTLRVLEAVYSSSGENRSVRPGDIW
ncbi:MAG: hypothetical protein O3B43_06365 [Chloroflexi bacterium]|nr:hypothetical protein [Chloroflexota bacterium]